MSDQSTVQSDAEVEETEVEATETDEAQDRFVRLAAATTEVVNRNGTKYKIRVKSPELWDEVLHEGSDLWALLDEMGEDTYLAIGQGDRRPTKKEAEAIKDLCSSFKDELEDWPRGICAYRVVLNAELLEAEGEAEQAETEADSDE